MIKFRSEQIWHIFKLLLAFFISIFYRKKELWLIAERGVDARDNGYWLFMYVKKHHPEINVKFIIDRRAPDRKRILEYKKDLVNFRSMWHYILLWNSTHLISTHIQGYFPYVGLGLWVKKHVRMYRCKRHISLKHGITKDFVHFLEYSNTGLDMLVAGAKPEYDYFLSVYGYPDKCVKYTGFCRFDQLNFDKPKRQILVMPTWREWIYEKRKFADTMFVRTYLQLLQSKELNDIISQNDIQLVFYLHHQMQPYIDTFLQFQYDPNIVIAKEEDYDVQQLLKESSLLITDYSSVYFDFAYMLKPVIYYQFDLAEYRKSHYAEGWFDYNHSFGPVVSSQANLIKEIKQSVCREFSLEEKYEAYVKECFTLRDNHNTERVFDCISCL